MNTESGMWTTADGNLEKPFVCSVTDNSPMPSTTTTIKPLTNCPDDWYFYEDTNSCYFASDLFTWQKGEDYCASFGGHLASLHSSAERDFALSVYNGVLWLGLYTNDSTITKHTTWKWTDGSKVDFLPWYYPYLSEVKPPCIQLYGTFNYPIFMNANCTDKSYGLCKKPAATIPLPTSPPPPPQTEVKCLSGWQYLEKTNSCYSGISSGLLYYYGGAHNGWIGLYSDNNGVSWKWVDDSPFNYRVWNTGNPTRGGNLCANIYGSYQNSDNCNGSFNYVCQRSAYKTVM
uniref:C-type lectin domain-containing protein n=1 Tax=Panagrolaimus davidi TaxID=227884 RepID=A0A914PM15_9BILA